MKRVLTAIQIIFICFISQGQNSTVQPAASRNISTIRMTAIGNDLVQFSADLPPLRQLTGAPKAYYSYFWDFGDGSFNDVNLIDRDKPKHRYAKSGTYKVRLLATNNYASGVSPTAEGTFPVTIKSSSTVNINPDFFSEKENTLNLKMKVNRNPKPEEDLMAYIGYRNRIGANTSGSIVVFYNDLRFIHKSFGLTNWRTYHGESNTSLDKLAAHNVNPELPTQNIHPTAGNPLFNQPGTAMKAASEEGTFYDLPRIANAKIMALKKKYMDYSVFSYDNLQKGDQHFIFLKLQTFPDIIKDTNEVISMTAMMVPDDKSLQPELFEMTIQVLASHDPNQMRLVQNRINYRFMGKKKELTYKVEFQNIGKGPARNITLGISLPKQLNGASLKIDEVSPQLPWCDSISAKDESCMDTIRTADSIYLVIKNIYLPGLEQNLVKNEDSTKGFIKYTIKFAKKPKKIPFSSRASIKFDNNKPIQTNQATAKFIKGLSPAIVAGYNLSLSNGGYSAKGPVQIGYMLAPYAPSRPYFQMEVYLGILEEEQTLITHPQSGDELKLFTGNYNATHQLAQINISTGEKDTVYTKKRNMVQLVPLHFRYNINNWISVGIGISGQIAISEKVTANENRYYHGYYSNRDNKSAFDTSTEKAIVNKSLTGTQMWTESTIAPFADIQVGRVRQTGPFLGLRYYRQFQSDIPNRFFMYAGIKL